jgi:hypothetical protein
MAMPKVYGNEGYPSKSSIGFTTMNKPSDAVNLLFKMVVRFGGTGGTRPRQEIVRRIGKTNRWSGREVGFRLRDEEV